MRERCTAMAPLRMWLDCAVALAIPTGIFIAVRRGRASGGAGSTPSGSVIWLAAPVSFYAAALRVLRPEREEVAVVRC